ncbi:stage V sporulation protein E [Irregularibacter muris]|uniref:Probable peptidoglycan glycosyltransferase FtsW n=1 Tax=Irregularibacter muris TaxID=1796619 RepID=A0AAE3KYR0_9FIRM|nr:stage V sporulation protein E [Irregularibacter muris]MCR1898020.1 stage V sporulation protein E [Irregularibacter muris]
MAKKNPADFIIIFSVVLLTSLGIIMVFSASQYSAGIRFNDDFYFLKGQLRWAVLGFIVMGVASKFPYKKLRKFSKIILLICIILLIVVLIPGLGRNVKGATRWIGIGPFTLQPSEVVKLGMIIFMADSLSKKREEIRTFSKGILPYLALALLVCGLIFVEPDLSTSVVVAGIIFAMMFVAGANLKHIVGLGSLSIPVLGVLIATASYRLKRFTSFLNPWEDIAGDGYQVVQSLLALGSGGLFGQGLGNGKQKLLYIPEAQNDFILAHIGEELGLIGTVTILFLFMLLIWRGIRIALHAPDMFASLFACGIVFMIGFQVLINVAVVTSFMPVTGMPLPFISAGGSSLVFLLGGIGVLLNISRYTKLDS